MSRITKNIPKKIKLWTASLVLVAVSLSSFNILNNPANANACSALPNTYGSSTVTVTVPTAGTYRVWSRIMVPNTTNNSYTLEIGDNVCGVAVGNDAIPANTWTWVSYRDGTKSSRTDFALNAGSQAVRFIGSEADVKVDKVLITADLSCTPTDGSTSQCATQGTSDTTPPSISLSTPAPNSSVGGTIALNANAQDNVKVTKVEFLVNGKVIATDSEAPYSHNWDTRSVGNGSHTIVAKAYDAANNSASSAEAPVTIINPATSVPTPTATPATGGTGATPNPTANPTGTGAAPTPPATSPTANGAVFTPVADARVSEDNPGRNYGQDDMLRIRDDSKDWKAYIKFEVKGISAPVKKVTLRLYATNGGPQAGSVYASGSEWQETAVTWSNAPARSPTLLAKGGSVADNNWTDFDITGAVTKNGTYSFNLISATSNSIFFSSRESANAPQLIIEN